MYDMNATSDDPSLFPLNHMYEYPSSSFVLGQVWHILIVGLDSALGVGLVY